MIKSPNKILLLLIAALLAATLSSCSSANQDSPLNLLDASGNHPGGWIAAHGVYAAPDGSLCVDCHGDDLAGGISGVSCSSDAVGCHANGPAFHPVDWLNKTAAGFTWHGYSYQNGLLIGGLDCEDCHTPPALDDPGGGKCTICHFGVGGSRSPGGWTHGSIGHEAFAGSPEEQVCIKCHEVNNSFGFEPFCHNCHDIHNVPYLNHETVVPASGDFTSQCSSCHSMSDPPISSAPTCTSCHTVGNPYIQTNCTSCHGNPPNTGEHGEHSGGACSDCHLNAGSGSGLNHYYDGEVDVEFSVSPFTYNPVLRECTGTCHIGGETETHTDRDW